MTTKTMEQERGERIVELNAIQTLFARQPDQETYEEMERLRGKYRDALFKEQCQSEDFSQALVLCSSEEVARALSEIAPNVTDEQLRELLLGNWTRCEAHRDYRAQLVAMFRRVGFLTDVETLPWTPRRRKPLTIYRGNLGEIEPVGISWTLDRERGYFFASWAVSLRARMVLGINPENPRPTVWEARVAAKDVLGYFDERGEQEVVVDPETVFDARPIAVAVEREEGGAMKLTIWSHFEGKTWTGEIPGTFEDGSLDVIFRLFNRVEEGDAERLEAWGYTLPSLSVGDRVTVAGQRFVVMPIGFEEEPVGAAMPETLKEKADMGTKAFREWLPK